MKKKENRQKEELNTREYVKFPFFFGIKGLSKCEGLRDTETLSLSYTLQKEPRGISKMRETLVFFTRTVLIYVESGVFDNLKLKFGP